MKKIQKSSSPAEFEAWIANKAPTFPSYSNASKLWDKLKPKVKQALRTRLYEDQGGICCYCQSEIANDETSVIEHLLPKSLNPLVYTFDFDNVILSCDGEKYIPKPKESHCDDSKKDFLILVNPLQDDCESKFSYTRLGRILGVGVEAEQTINILNLDTPKLQIRRKREFDFVLDELDETLELEEDDSRTVLEAKIAELTQRDSNNLFQPFCAAIISLIRQEYKLA